MTVSDKELLELAAKAAGYDANLEFNGDYSLWNDCECIQSTWNPLAYDGDAMRLAVNLGLVVDCSRPSAGEPFKQHAIWLDETCDNETLTRRAIVRAAAEIGKEMK